MIVSPAKRLNRSRWPLGYGLRLTQGTMCETGIQIPIERGNFEGGKGAHCKVQGTPFMCGGDAAFCQITLTTCYDLATPLILSRLCVVPPGERFDLSDVVKFKLNTSGVSGNDVISARLGVYIRPSSSQPRQRWRGSSQRRHRGSSPLSRVQVRDVTRSHAVHRTIRRTVYHVGQHGHWIVFEASS